ncbi:MAG TPA: GIY-YIG nuclease family protein [Verrucomicrobiae bacterium]|nr:GIY-YIG nuclease family protein [Verrucomicrobiae bacterium]
MSKPKTLANPPLFLRHDLSKDRDDSPRMAGLAPAQGGQVYFLGSQLGTKIGCAADARSRVRSLDGMLPFETEILHIITTDDRYGLEQAFHFYFSDKHIRGEWFSLTPEDIAFIKSLDGPPPTPKPPNHPYMTEDVPF